MSRGIDITRWREYGQVLTDSLWLFAKRGEGGDGGYQGNFVPQIPEQLIERYTEPGDVVVDPFLGSGTTMDVALRLGRRCMGVELNDALAKSVYARVEAMGYGPEWGDVLSGDSTEAVSWEHVRGPIKAVMQAPATLAILHPPYEGIVKFSSDPRDLSTHCGIDFQVKLDRVVTQATATLEVGGHLALVIGDVYRKGEVYPLGFQSMLGVTETLLDAVRLKGIIVKDINGNEKGKGKDANLWRYRALRHGFYVFKHEYIFVWQKVRET